jgi:hypothetical protein
MIDRSAALDAAVRAQDKLIAEARGLLKAYVQTSACIPTPLLTICSGSSTAPASARRSVWCVRRLARILVTTHRRTGLFGGAVGVLAG